MTETVRNWISLFDLCMKNLMLTVSNREGVPPQEIIVIISISVK